MRQFSSKRGEFQMRQFSSKRGEFQMRRRECSDSFRRSRSARITQRICTRSRGESKRSACEELTCDQKQGYSISLNLYSVGGFWY
jgi:hypothetical protein